MTAFSWRQLGALTQNLGNLSKEKVEAFLAAGGRYVCPVLLNDRTAADNIARLPALRAQLAGRANVGGWFNGDAISSASVLAGQVEAIVRAHNLSPIILDLEFPYKDGGTCSAGYSSSCADRMPELLVELRQRWRIGTKAIAVTSFGNIDRAMIWGGQNRFPSFRKLGIRCIPQWYFNDPHKYPDHDSRYAPDYCMKTLFLDGAIDGNLSDHSYSDWRGLPADYVKGLLEPTGVQEASLRDGLSLTTDAQLYGYSKGLLLYLLERVDYTFDWAMLSAQRGKLFT